MLVFKLIASISFACALLATMTLFGIIYETQPVCFGIVNRRTNTVPQGYERQPYCQIYRIQH